MKVCALGTFSILQSLYLFLREKSSGLRIGVILPLKVYPSSGSGSLRMIANIHWQLLCIPPLVLIRNKGWNRKLCLLRGKLVNDPCKRICLKGRLRRKLNWNVKDMIRVLVTCNPKVVGLKFSFFNKSNKFLILVKGLKSSLSGVSHWRTFITFFTSV